MITIKIKLENDEWVATSPDFPSLSWVSESEIEAYEGLKQMILEIKKDFV